MTLEVRVVLSVIEAQDYLSNTLSSTTCQKKKSVFSSDVVCFYLVLKSYLQPQTSQKIHHNTGDTATSYLV